MLFLYDISSFYSAILLINIIVISFQCFLYRALKIRELAGFFVKYWTLVYLLRIYVIISHGLNRGVGRESYVKDKTSKSRLNYYSS